MKFEEFKAATGISEALARKFYEPVLNGFKEFNVYTPLRMAHFLAQIGHESQGFTKLEEDLRYGAARLVQVFKGRNGLTPAIAAGLVGHPRELANFIYGGAWGRANLGNTQPNDGYDFRGSGFMHTTGRDNHEAAAEGLGIKDVHRSAELMRTDPDFAVRAASFYWWQRKIQPAADADNLQRVTKLINSGLEGLDSRRKLLVRAKGVLC